MVVHLAIIRSAIIRSNYGERVLHETSFWWSVVSYFFQPLIAHTQSVLSKLLSLICFDLILHLRFSLVGYILCVASFSSPIISFVVHRRPLLLSELFPWHVGQIWLHTANFWFLLSLSNIHHTSFQPDRIILANHWSIYTVWLDNWVMLQ